MSVFNVQYRLVVYAPATVDPTENTPLTPAVGAVHADPFKVSTMASLSGFRGYLYQPTGKKGSYDPKKGTYTTGELSCKLIDAKTGTSNLQRWVSAFLGDVNGQTQWVGLRATIEESTDNGVTWTPYYAGRVSGASLDDPLHYGLSIRGSAVELQYPAFVYRPSVNATNALMTSVLPCGLTANYGPFNSQSLFSATVYAGDSTSSMLLPDATSLASRRNRVGDLITKLINGSPNDRANGSPTNGGLYYGVDTNNGDFADQFRVQISSASVSGEFLVAGFVVERITASGADANANAVGGVWYSPTATTDAKYLPLSAFPPGSVVQFRMVPSLLPISDTNPVYIDHTHPVQLLSDLATGQYGFTDANTRQPVRGMYLNTSSFNQLLGSGSFDMPRFRVNKQMKAVDFIEKYLAPSGIGYRVTPLTISGSMIVGAMTVFDSRIPSNLVGLPTITNADISALASIKWSLGNPLTSLQLTSYDESETRSLPDVSKNNGNINIPTSFISETPNILREIIPAVISTGQANDLAFDVLGLRTPSPSPVTASVGFVNLTTYNRRMADSQRKNLVQYYETRFGRGPATVEMVCRRTAVTNPIDVGQWVILNVDVLPNASIHQRGGSRLLQVTSRTEADMTIQFTFIDGGTTLYNAMPTFGAMSISGNTLTVPVTASTSQMVYVNIAETLIGAGQPAQESAQWHASRRNKVVFQTGLAIGSGSSAVTIGNLPSNRRYYVRAQATSFDGLLPSLFAYPAPAFVDNTALATPTSLTYSNITAQSVRLSWNNNGDTGSMVGIAVAQPTSSSPNQVALLQAQSTYYDLIGLSSASADNPLQASVYHIDSYGGMSVSASVNFTLSGSLPTCPSMAGLYISNIGVSS